MRDLDPSKRIYHYPDFGFNDKLNIGVGHQCASGSDNVWHLLTDFISAHPKYERLRNHIKILAKFKLEFVKRQLQEAKKLEQQNTQGMKHKLNLSPAKKGQSELTKSVEPNMDTD